MGYTNYWKQPTDFTDKEWTLVKKEFDYISEIVGDQIIVDSIQDAIVFNGGKGGNCETFVLNKHARTEKHYEGDDLAFNFCKTRALPYDLAVWHILTFCQMIKDDFKPYKDGWSYKSEEGEADDLVDKGNKRKTG